jgi:hypothetical protein
MLLHALLEGVCRALKSSTCEDWFAAHSWCETVLNEPDLYRPQEVALFTYLDGLAMLRLGHSGYAAQQVCHANSEDVY